MKREELIAFGVKEENVKDFFSLYWDDVNKQARKLAMKPRKQPEESAGDVVRENPAQSKEAATVAAIVALLRLIDDPVRLNFILTTVSKEYNFQEKEKERREYAAQVEGLRQKIHQAKSVGQEDEKAGEIPEAAPEVC